MTLQTNSTEPILNTTIDEDIYGIIATTVSPYENIVEETKPTKAPSLSDFTDTSSTLDDYTLAEVPEVYHAVMTEAQEYLGRLEKDFLTKVYKYGMTQCSICNSNTADGFINRVHIDDIKLSLVGNSRTKLCIVIYASSDDRGMITHQFDLHDYCFQINKIAELLLFIEPPETLARMLIGISRMMYNVKLNSLHSNRATFIHPEHISN